MCLLGFKIFYLSIAGWVNIGISLMIYLQYSIINGNTSLLNHTKKSHSYIILHYKYVTGHITEMFIHIATLYLLVAFPRTSYNTKVLDGVPVEDVILKTHTHE